MPTECLKKNNCCFGIFVDTKNVYRNYVQDFLTVGLLSIWKRQATPPSFTKGNSEVMLEG